MQGPDFFKFDNILMEKNFVLLQLARSFSSEQLNAFYMLGLM